MIHRIRNHSSKITRRRAKRLRIEALEPRLVLDAGPLVISEFMAVNDSVLADQDGDFSDWIEIYNPSDADVELGGWYLTDSSNNLSKWEFPALTLQQGGYLTVFASDKDRTDPTGPLHTNFKLSGGGEYLALVQPDGTTIASDFEPEYPEQLDNVSYGISQAASVLLAEGADLTYLVPTAAEADLGTSWTEPGYGTSDWVGPSDTSPVLITEAGTDKPDYFEIQNVAAYPAVTTGWIVATNHAQSYAINDVAAKKWDLPDEILPGQVIPMVEFLSGDIYWRTDAGGGWVMLLDQAGQVADFVVWGYTAEEIAGLEVDINEYHITAADFWTGPGATNEGTATNSLQRHGSTDNNSLDDFSFTDPQTVGTQNAGMSVPYSGVGTAPPTTGVGFNASPGGFRVTRYAANVTVNDVNMAEAVIDNTAWQTSVSTQWVPTVDYLDSGTDGHYVGNRPFPGIPSGSGADNVVVEVIGSIVIPQAGSWTFGAASDDGFLLELTGPSQSFSLSHPGLRGTADTLGVFDVVEAGTYDLRAVYFDRFGGASFELFATEGAHGSFNTSAFDLLGDVSAGGLATVGFSDAYRTNALAEVHNVNASLWTRVPFTVTDPAQFDTLTLRMQYNDGFVAYLNGQEIARRNAPTKPQWNSQATASRSIENSLGWERIPVSSSLAALQSGTNVLAVHAMNSSPGDANLLMVPELIASRNLDADWGYMDLPTPGAENSSGIPMVADTKFSVGRGIFDQPFAVEITTLTPGATIRYTRDGSMPTEMNGYDYVGPISVNTTMTLRAAAFFSDWEPTNVDTQTYIFPARVASQRRPAGYPTSWGGEPSADYDVDQSISRSAQYADDFQEGLTAIPSLSLVLPMEDFFGSAGLYSNVNNDTLEKLTSAELIFADGTKGFQIDAGLKMQGGASRNVEAAIKHSMSLRFRAEYGEGRLEYPLFEGSPVERFNSIHLRAMYNNSWIHRTQGQRDRAQLIRDQWARDTMIDMGQEDAGRGIYVNVYVNGLFWGVYNMHERPEASHYAEYNGGDDATLDASNGGTWNDGNGVSYSRMKATVASRNWGAIQEVLDVDNYIDWYLIQQFGYNADLKNNGNWRAAGGGPDDMPWHFYAWDTERILEIGYLTNAGNLPVEEDPPGLFNTLIQVSEFRMMFADRLHKHLFNDGAMTPQANADRWMERADEINEAIVGESARWGDDRPGGPYNRDGHWLPEQDVLINDYFPYRTEHVINYFRSRGYYPSTAAPTYRVNGAVQHGGRLNDGDQLIVTAASGTIYYTLDGSDPRLPGGSISPAAITATNGTQIILSESSHIKARARRGTTWSALDEVTFLVHAPADAENLTVSEIYYHPTDPTEAELAVESDFSIGDFEFLELKNVGTETIDLYGVQVADGVSFDFTDATQIALEASFNVGTEAFVYNDDAFGTGSPNAAEGNYHLLGGATGGGLHVQLGPQSGSPASGAWSRSVQLDQGGPLEVSLQYRMIVEAGVDTTEYGEAILEIDGIRYGTDTADSLAHLSGDGDGGGAFDTGWRTATFAMSLSAGNHTITLGGYATPLNGADEWVDVFFDNVVIARHLPLAVLQPGEHVVIIEDENAFAARYDLTGVLLAGEFRGQLDDGGEIVQLVDAAGETIQQFTYNDSGAWPGRADGSGSSLELLDSTGDLDDPDLWRSSSEYGGSPGSDGAGPRSDIVINEVLTHTDLPLLDSIELINTTDSAIDIGGWYLSDSNANYRKYQIPQGTTIPGGGFLVLDESDFNPTPLVPGPDDFALSGAHGDDVWLLQAGADKTLVQFVDHVEFDAAAAGESFGRWPDPDGKLYPMTDRTLGEANAGPRVGPIVISELMYQPPNPGGADVDGLEFVEIYNPTGEVLDLHQWRIRGGVDFDFAEATQIQPHGVLVVVPFELTDTIKLAAFREYYTIDATVELVGPYSGKLDDDGERVQLQRPDSPPAEEPNFIPRLLEDEVRFYDTAPWPVEAAGTGRSLARLNTNLWGRDPASWEAAIPTPGLVQFIVTDDAYEPNNTVETAFDLAGNAQSWLSTMAGEAVQADADWYRIEVPATHRRLIVDLTSTGNIGMQVTNAAGQVFDTADVQPDGLLLDAVLPTSGQWYLRVDGDHSGSTYDLRWDTQSVHPGDADLSGATDLSDFNIWNANKFVAGTDWTTGDFNSDGNTDLSDFNIWNAYKFTSTPQPAPLIHDAAIVEAASESPATDGLLWLAQWAQSARQTDPDPDINAKARVVDALLATYWP